MVTRSQETTTRNLGMQGNYLSDITERILGIGQGHVSIAVARMSTNYELFYAQLVCVKIVWIRLNRQLIVGLYVPMRSVRV